MIMDAVGHETNVVKENVRMPTAPCPNLYLDKSQNDVIVVLSYSIRCSV